MGGHSAWRKRHQHEENAVNFSGSISRHRPHSDDGVKRLDEFDASVRNSKKNNKWSSRTPSLKVKDEDESCTDTGDTDNSTPAFLCAGTDSEAVLPLRYSMWLVATSLLFLIPGWLAHRSSQYGLSALYSATGLVSANYWRRQCNGARRNLDLLCAKTSFFATFTAGVSRVEDPSWLQLGWPLAIAIPLVYLLSIELHRRESILWISAHAAMHVGISMGMTVVVLGSNQ